MKFINVNKHSPEYLSLFVDEELRAGAKGRSDEELEQLFDHVITLYRYLEDKVCRSSSRSLCF